MPSEIHRMCTSSTPDPCCCSTAMSQPSGRDLHLFELERVDEQLLARHDLQIDAAAALAPQRKAPDRRLGATVAAAAAARHVLDHQLRALKRRALREQLEGEF